MRIARLHRLLALFLVLCMLCSASLPVYAEALPIYSVNIYIEIYGKTMDELANLEQQVKIELAGVGITYDQLNYEQRNGFSSVQPLGSDHFILCSNNLPSKTAAALYPFSYSSLIHPHGMPLGRTDRGGPVYADIFQRDDQITNGVFFISGSAGQGKSYLQKKILTFMVTRGVHCYVMDPENEYSDVTRGLGGVVIDCASGNHKINIFEVRRIKLEDDVEEGAELPEISNESPMFLQHLSWLKDEFRIMMPEMPDSTLRALMILVQGMYASVGIDQHTDFDRLRHEDYPTFSTLYDFVQKQLGKNSYPMLTKEMISEVLLYINDPTYGELSNIFNGTTTIDVKNNPLICFSMGALLEGSEQRLQAVENNLNTYIWSIVLLREFQVLLSFDELYMYLEQPLMAKYISYFARRSRKYNACIGVATQQLQDCLDESVRRYSSPIINMSSFKFLFYSGQVDLQDMKEALKLTDGEAACISVSNKRHCLLKAGNGKYYMEVGTLPSYTGESEVMEQYLQELQAATLNDDWEGWSEVNIEWTKVLYQTDWEDLYGVTVTQIGITNTDSFTPSEDYTGGITGSGNGTFIIPLASYSYISCHFGEPDGWTGAPHGGMDFAAGYGTPIYAAADGVVVKAGYHNSWGNYVKIYHGVVDGNQIYTLYAHCSSLGVSAGQTVTQGQTIAAVGSTGDSTGNHLHFEVYVNSTRVAPENWL